MGTACSKKKRVMKIQKIARRYVKKEITKRKKYVFKVKNEESWGCQDGYISRLF